MRTGFLLAAGIGLLIAGIFTALTSTVVVFILPESFASTARIDPAVTGPASQATEVQRMQSQQILLRVITNLNLSRTWAQKMKEDIELPPAVTYALLKKQIEVRASSKTQLIEIRVYSEDRNEAAVIANEIAAVYRDSRLAASDPGGRASVQIVDRAVPGLRPVRPNKPLAIGIGCAVGIACAAAGVALLLGAGFAVRSKKAGIAPLPTHRDRTLATRLA
jgi:capsular polysaccharide biosynthesis protein